MHSWNGSFSHLEIGLFVGQEISACHLADEEAGVNIGHVQEGEDLFGHQAVEPEGPEGWRENGVTLDDARVQRDVDGNHFTGHFPERNWRQVNSIRKYEQLSWLLKWNS